MTKIIDWKIKIPLTNYSIQRYHYGGSEFERSGTDSALVMSESMEPEV